MKHWKCIVCGETAAGEELPECCPKCNAPADQIAAEEVNPFQDEIEIKELDDDQLDAIVGGYAIGDVVRCQKYTVEYCSRCGQLLLQYDATITGVRGVQDGKTVYWITRSCCGYRTCVIETAILG